MKTVETSIILLTLNAGDNFQNLLKAIFNQTYKNFEVIIIDSSSTDRTLDYAIKYPVRIFSIPRSDFGHGKTRNLGAKLAKGKYLVYITQDALPVNVRLLSNLLINFNYLNVVGVFGRQIPRPETIPPDRYSYNEDYSSKRIILTKNNYLNRNVIFSNVLSAIRKDVLLKYPFLDYLLVSEDYYWSNKVLNEGYKIVYEPSAVVVHSHIYSIYQIFKLNFDQGVGFSQMIIKDGKIRLGKNSSQRFLNKIKYFSFGKQYKWIIYIIFVDFLRFIALTLGVNHKFIPKIIKNRLSLTKYCWE